MCNSRRMRIPVRQYIQQTLYHPTEGYFSNARSPVLGYSKRPRLRSIRSRAEYQKYVAAAYAGAEHGWMTPVELFSPHLSKAIGKRIHSIAPKDEAFHIVEVGAGRGTLCCDLLDHWSVAKPELLDKVRYNIVEISSSLAQLQSAKLKAWIERGVVAVHNANATEWFDSAVGESLSGKHCHIIAAEVLDNLPHDLIRETETGLEQAVMVAADCGRGQSEELQWSSEIDGLTLAAMQAFGFDQDSGGVTASPPGSFVDILRAQFEQLLGGGKREVWVPTGSHALLDAIAKSVPHAHMTVSDFHSLPGSLPGENGPVVQSVDGGATVVYSSVQTAPFGKVDIMFPTNFAALARCHSFLTQERGHLHVRRVMSQQQFFDEHASEEIKEESTCQDGYNPILQDFRNASFFLADRVG